MLKIKSLRIFEWALALSACAVMASCQEKDAANVLTLSAEGFAGDAKMTVSDCASYWQNGDRLVLSYGANWQEKTVTVAAGQAYISDVENAPVVSVSPSTAYKTFNSSSNQLTVKMPHEYQYTEADGMQVLNAPMAAYGVQSGSLKFKHLTGALNIVLKHNYYDNSYPEYDGLVVDRIIVKARKRGDANYFYKLNGDFIFDASNIQGITGSTAQAASDDEKELVMTFYNVDFRISANSQIVQIPIPAVGNESYPPAFSITVEGHIDGKKFSYSKEQTSYDACKPLGRGQLGYVPLTVEPPFNYAPLFTEYSDGYIEATTPAYLITTPAEFKLMVDAINNYWNDGNYYYRDCRYYLYPTTVIQDHNIIYHVLDMTGIPIESIRNFNGLLSTVPEVQNALIKNLTVESYSDNGSEFECFGLFFKPRGLPQTAYDNYDFCFIRNITFQNLKLKRNASSSYTNYMIGSICSYFDEADPGIAGSQTPYILPIDNCKITANNVNGLSVDYNGVTPNRVIFGGMIGRMKRTVRITNSRVELAKYVNLSVNSNVSTANVGGLVGEMSPSAGLQNLRDTIIVSGETGTGDWGVGIWTIDSPGRIYFGGLVGSVDLGVSNISASYTIVKGSATINCNSSNANYFGKVTGYDNRDALNYVDVSGFTINVNEN